jgi:uncharacterized MAPEG superfamily protein
MTFVAAHIVYIGVYVADLATVRSIVWTVGFLASLALFFVRLM